MNPIWLVRMARWVRNPPKAWQFYTVLGIVAAAAVLVGIELLFGWPEALTVEPARRGGRLNAP